jgi:thioredoxin 1
MEPAVHAMAAKFTDVQFAKIDVDELPVCTNYSLS